MSHLEELENLISILYCSSDVAARKRAEEQLILYQKDPQAWNWSLDLLKGSQNSQFFGALTLYTKINSLQWESFDHTTENLYYLRDRLLQAYIAVIGSPSYVVAKMAQCLVAFIMRVLPEHWSTFLSDVSEALETLARSKEELRVSSTIAYLEFLKTLVETVESIRISNEKRSKIEQIIIDQQVQVVSVLLSLLSNSTPTIAQKCIETAKTWSNFGLPMNMQMQLLDAILNHLHEDQLLESILDMLAMLLSKNTIRQQKATYFPKFLSLLTDGIIGSKFKQAFPHDQHVVSLISQLFVEFGEAFTEAVVLTVGEKRTNEFLVMVLNITGINGSFSVEEDVSSSTLYFWFLLQEIIVELDLISKGLNPWLVELFNNLVLILVKKSIFASDWFKWSQDAKEQFRSLRNDIADTYGYCFEVIGHKVLDSLVDCANSSGQNNDPLLESCIFGIKSLSEYVSSTNYGQLIPIFGFIPQVEKTENYQLSATCLNFLSAFSDALNVFDHRYLYESLNFIFSSIRKPQLSKDALLCLERICSSCRVKLLDHSFSWVFDAMLNSSSVVALDERHRLVASMMILLHQLPSKQSQAQESLLLNGLLQNLHSSWGNSPFGPHLSCISAFIRSQAGTVFTNEESKYWDSSLLQAYSSLCMELEKIFSVVAADPVDSSLLSRLVIDICRLEIAAIYEKKSSLFNAALLCCSLDDHFQYYEVCAELSMIAIIQTGDVSLIQNLIEFTLSNLLPVLDETPDTISLLWKCLTDILSQSSSDFLKVNNLCMEHIFKIFLPKTLMLSDRFTLLAVMDFLIAIIQFQGSPCWSRDLFLSIGPGLCVALVGGIEGKMVPSLLPKISDVLLKLTIKYPDQVRMWLEAIFSDPNFITSIPIEEKKKFINGLLGTRQIRKHRDLIKSFSLKCRGLENTEFANCI